MRNPQIILSDHNIKPSKYSNNILGKLVTIIFLLVGLFSIERCFTGISAVFIGIMAICNLTLILAVLVKDEKKWTYIKYGFVIIALLAAAIPPMPFVTGFLNFANQIIEVWNNHFDGSVVSYEMDALTAIGLYKFWIFTNIIIGLILSYFVRKEKLEIMGLLILLIMLFAAFFQLNVNVACYGVFTIGLLLSFTGENLYLQKIKRIFPFFLMLLIVVGVIFFATRGFVGSRDVYNIKEGFLDDVDHFRYGEDTLPQGSMVKAKNMVGKEDQITLTLEGKLKNEVHLRGFVGSEFKNNKWEVLSGKKYIGKMNGFLDWLNNKNFNSQYQYAQYCTLSGISQGKTKVTIKNLGAYRKYLYMPYTAVSLDLGSGNVNRDWQVKSKGLFGESEYTFTLTDDSDSADKIIYKKIAGKDDASKNYNQAQSVYGSFVYDNYLEVDENEKALIEDKVFDQKKWNKKNIAQITSKIRLTLQAYKNTISKKPTAYTGSEDFIQWFIDGKKKCNSSYYATVATLAYRTVGIPARYVEGYYLDKTAITDKDGIINVSEADAHGWVEIYIDEIGWMPVEVTPGFYSTEYKTSEVAPSPNSTVNIVKDEDESISGKTSDSLNKKKNEQKPLTPKEKVLYGIGIGLLILLILVVLRLLLELQVILRRKYFTSSVNRTNDKEIKCRLIFDKACAILAICGISKDFRFPYECGEKFVESFHKLQLEEYNRFLELIEKSIFSNGRLQDSEMATVESFLERMTAEAYENATFLEKIKLKYIHAI